MVRSAHGSAVKVLVTGANGFLGRRVASALAARGARVRAHGRTMPTSPLPGVEHVAGDLCDTGSLAGLVDGVDAVCHFAAFTPPNHADSSFAPRCYEVNALVSLRLAEAALEGVRRRFVLASAANAYAVWPQGEAQGRRPVAEDEAPYPAARATFYLASKALAELYLEHLARTRGLLLTSLRISSPYGHGMPQGSVVARFMALAAEGKALTVRDGGLPRADFVWVDDVVDLVVAALDAPGGGTFNAGSGEHTSLLDLARAVQATYADRAVAVTVEPPPLGAEPAPSFAAIDIGKAKRAFGYAPRPLAEGLAVLRRAAAAGEL